MKKTITLSSITQYSLIAALSGLNLGVDIGSIGSLITNFKSFQEKYKNLTDFKTGLMISIFNLGGLFGGLFLSKCNNEKGINIKFVICLNLLIVLLGQLFQISGFNSWIFFVFGRFLFGLGQGGNNVLCPFYISEICKTFNDINKFTKGNSVETSKASYFQLLITLGILIGNVSNYFFQNYISNNSWQWRMPIFINIVITISMFSLFYFKVPDHQELVAYANNEINKFSTETLISLEREEKEEEYSYMKEKMVIEDKYKERKTFWKLWHGKPLYFWRVVIGSTILIFQQFTGINYFFYYSSILFKDNDTLPTYLINIALSSINFVATLIGLYIIKKISPKKILLFGYIGCSGSMFIFATLGVISKNPNLNLTMITYSMALITSIFIIFFAVFLGPISFIIIEKILPAESKLKTLGLGISNSFNWITGFLIGALTPTINSLIGLKLGYVFCVITIFGLIFEYLNLPDMYGLDEKEREKVWYLIDQKIPNLQTIT